MSKNSAISKLKKLQKAWGKAEPKTFGKQFPDDDYVVKIKNAVVEESKTGRLQVNWTLRILEGKFKGKEITHRSGLETEDNLSYFQGELETLELEIPDNLEDIGDVLQEALGLELTVALSTRGDFQNVRFGELLEATEKVDKDEDEDEDEDEEKPSKKSKKPKHKKEKDEDEEDEDGGNEKDEEDEDDDKYPSKEKIMNMDQDDLLELVDEYELDIDKPKKLSLKELRKAVIEASVFEEELDEDEDSEDEEDEENED